MTPADWERWAMTLADHLAELVERADDPTALDDARGALRSFRLVSTGEIVGDRPGLDPQDRARRADLARVVHLVGEEAWQNDPVVHNGLNLIRHGTDPEEALALVVRVLSSLYDRATKDMVAIAQTRPLTLRVTPPEGP